MYDEEIQRVERTDVGVSIFTKIQRGTGTNDRDTIEAKAKAAIREDAEAELEELRPALREHVATVREWQPDDEESE